MRLFGWYKRSKWGTARVLEPRRKVVRLELKAEDVQKILEALWREKNLSIQEMRAEPEPFDVLVSAIRREGLLVYHRGENFCGHESATPSSR